MKKIILFLVGCILLIGCQPTPEQEIVTNRYEQNIETLAQNSPEPNTTPLWDEISAVLSEREISVENIGDNNQSIKKIHVSHNWLIDQNQVPVIIDLDIDVPINTTWPIYEIEKYEMRVEEKKKIIEDMAEGNPVFSGVYHPTKIEFAQMIKDAEESDIVAQIDKSNAESGSRQTVREMLEEYYEDAALENIETAFSWDAYTESNLNYANGHYYDDQTKEWRNFSLHENNEGISIDTSSNYIATARLVYNGAVVGSSPGEILNDPQISFEDANRTVINLMAVWGADDMILSPTETMLGKRLNLYTGETVSVGWYIVYRKGIENVLCCTKEERSDEQDYISPWPQEIFRCFVDGNGIWSIAWIGPSTIGRKVGESVKLINFNVVWDRMLDQIKIENATLDANQFTSIEITSMQLGYGLIPKRDAISIGYSIPVWYIEYQRNVFDGYHDYRAIAINALDGSIISVRPNRG